MVNNKVICKWCGIHLEKNKNEYKLIRVKTLKGNIKEVICNECYYTAKNI